MKLLTALFASVIVTATAARTVPPSPVADAAMRDDITTVRRLLKDGANASAAQGDGMTAL